MLGRHAVVLTLTVPYAGARQRALLRPQAKLVRLGAANDPDEAVAIALDAAEQERGR